MARVDDKKSGGFKIAFFILLLIIIGVATGCIFSPTFNITDVKVEDNLKTASGDIISVANIPLGVNIFRINDSKIESAVENLPYVKEANIVRKFPSTVAIKVEERTPYAIVKHLESFVITDKYGYVLEVESENTHQELPIVYGIDIAQINVGKKLDGTALTKYENCAYLLETSYRIEFKYKFSEINYDDPTNVKLYIKENDLDIIYGNVYINNIEEKLTHLSSIIEHLNGKKGKLDMSNEDYLARTVFTEK